MSKIGRPKLAKAKAKGILIAVRFSPEEARSVEQAAKRSNKGKSAWVRETLLAASTVKD